MDYGTGKECVLVIIFEYWELRVSKLMVVS